MDVGKEDSVKGFETAKSTLRHKCDKEEENVMSLNLQAPITQHTQINTYIVKACISSRV